MPIFETHYENRIKHWSKKGCNSQTQYTEILTYTITQLFSILILNKFQHLHFFFFLIIRQLLERDSNRR